MHKVLREKWAAIGHNTQNGSSRKSTSRQRKNPNLPIQMGHFFNFVGGLRRNNRLTLSPLV
jgi:hypothetical protein